MARGSASPRNCLKNVRETFHNSPRKGARTNLNPETASGIWRKYLNRMNQSKSSWGEEKDRKLKTQLSSCSHSLSLTTPYGTPTTQLPNYSFHPPASTNTKQSKAASTTMSMLNYHEMTMNESQHSPAKRKQFLLICTVMAGVFLHSVLTSGGFNTVHIESGIFPGGEFVYKHTSRDYAASGSLTEYVAKDVGLKPKQYADTMYTLYMDDPAKLGGRRQRFACGHLSSPGDKLIKRALLEKNAEFVPATKADIYELAAGKLWPKLPYQAATLPTVAAATVQFPFTGGFVSALVHSYKVIPALRKRVLAKTGPGNPAVVMTTCSIKEQMCTHYAPLLKSKKFFLGLPDSEAYLASLPKEQIISVDWRGFRRMFTRVLPFLKYFQGEAKEEL